MKERNIFIGIIILAIIAIGTFAYRTAYKGEELPPQVAPMTNGTPATVPGKTSTAPIENPSVLTMTVRYTGTGFDPQSVTIAKGAAVRFTNESSQNVWVASAPHPAHTDYPGFDSLKAIAPGGSYSFTFDRVGKWGYHNHLNPNQNGTVTVVE